MNKDYPLNVESSDLTDINDQNRVNFATTCLDNVIEISEIKAAMKSLKNKTSSSFDSINNEMIKSSSPDLQHILLNIFNIVLNSGIYPSSWRESILKPIFKKGKDDDPNNFRGIAISSCISKLFSRILYNRLDYFISQENIMHKNQIDFC